MTHKHTPQRDERHPSSADDATPRLRLAGSERSPDAPAAPRKEENRSFVFMSVFGGSLLSIAAMITITVYQQLSGGLSEIRTTVAHLTESRVDLVKNDDLNTRLTSVWATLKDLQASEAALGALKERTALLEQQLKATEAAGSVVSGLRERCALLEQQLKAAVEEHRDLTRQMQATRERLTAVESHLAGAVVAPTKPAARPRP